MSLRTTLLMGTALAVIVAGAMIYGAFRWKAGTHELRARLGAANTSTRPVTYDAREIEHLPLPVRRYFQAVLKDGQPIVSVARLTHAGEFNMGEVQAKWRHFTSTQIATMQRPGFDWDARIVMAPGLNVFVHDAYVAGEGILHVELLRLVTLADIRGTPEVARGQLMRFLAEAAWYPTALLPSQGVRWEPIDDISAKASLTDGSTTVSLVFHFGKDGLVSDVWAAARSRTVNGGLVDTPWRGRFWHYEIRNGMHVPMEGEVAWELPDGPWPYWRGRATEIAYDFAR